MHHDTAMEIIGNFYKNARNLLDGIPDDPDDPSSPETYVAAMIAFTPGVKEALLAEHLQDPMLQLKWLVEPIAEADGKCRCEMVADGTWSTRSANLHRD